jgi:hypothetical protein
LKCCHGKKENENEYRANIASIKTEKDSIINSLKLKIDSLLEDNEAFQMNNNLLLRLNDSILKANYSLANYRKAVIFVSDYVNANGDSGKLYTAIIVPIGNSGKSLLFVENVKCPPCLKEKDSCLKKICLDGLVNDSLDVYLTKQYRSDNPISLVQKKWSIRDIVSGNLAPYDYKHTYIEYKENPYRQKVENAFWWGVGTGAGAIALYATTEAMGHPQFFDDRDNSAAWRKHNLILGLRIGSGILGAVSAVEFERAWHFHKLEGKFIINPTQLGLNVSLDKPKK